MSNDRNAKPPMPTDGDRVPAARSTHSEIDEFLSKVKELAPATRPGPRGRLLFALDATMSRQPLWDTACQLQAEMFREAAAIGGLDIQLVYYRGLDECQASPWVSDARTLIGLMKKVHCEAGETQIERILVHARKEDIKQKVQALVFIGDACEENPDTLVITARKLSLPVFVFEEFQESSDPEVAKVFANIARLTNGAYCRFDQGSAKQLTELLAAVATYAAAGQQALKEISATNAGAVRLLRQLR